MILSMLVLMMFVVTGCSTSSVKFLSMTTSQPGDTEQSTNTEYEYQIALEGAEDVINKIQIKDISYNSQIQSLFSNISEPVLSTSEDKLTGKTVGFIIGTVIVDTSNMTKEEKENIKLVDSVTISTDNSKTFKFKMN